MQACRNEVYFYENFRLVDWIVSCLKKRTVFYNSQSFGLYLVSKLLGGNLWGDARVISYGDLTKSTGIRKTSYERALRKVGEINTRTWSLNLRAIIQIDSELIIEKFLFDFIFKKYEFYGLAKQYILEHQDCAFWIIVDPLLLDEDLIQNIDARIVKAKRFYRLEFITSIIAIPFFLYFFYMKYKKYNQRRFENSIICEVAHHRSYDLFRDLFGGYQNLHFVIQKCHLTNFKEEEIQGLGLITHGLSLSDYRKLKVVTWFFLTQAIRRGIKFSTYGPLLFELYKTIAHGILLTVNARNSVFITYEHMYTTKAVRNDLLRADNNKSIFLTYGVYMPDHFFTGEYKFNYDILCSSGELLERIYSMQKARTKILLPTGGYHPNKKSWHSIGFEGRVKQLLKFKGASTVITILSSGIQDETYSAEVRLMALACRLAEESGVKIIVRQKPVDPPAKYANFFIDATRNSKSILLTHTEYDLFDFLEVTDLFITVWSSSVVDLCAAGAQFFSINCWDDKDIYLWQTEVEGVYLEEQKAFDLIMGWVRDSPKGERDAHKKRMTELSNLISYKFKDFKTYKANLLAQLEPYLPSALA